MKWVVAGLLCASTLINYADRLTLSMVSVDVRGEFGLSETDYAHIVTGFLIAYAIAYALSGMVVDRLGTKRGFALFILAWSASQIAHAMTVGKWSLAGARFALGLSEPGNWPAAAKAVGEWFPASQRALAVGIFNAGSSAGSMLAPPMVAWLTLRYGWRASFVATGAMGLAVLAVWWVVYSSPTESQAQPAAGESGAEESVSWLRLMREPQCYSLILVRFLTDPVIYFVIFWLPEYLRKERGFDLAMVGKLAWVPFVFGGVGYVLGGWLSGRMMEAGVSLPQARKRVMLMGAAVMPAAMFAPFVPEVWLVIVTICFVTFGHAFWVSNLQTIPTDIYAGRRVGTVSGLSGMGGAIGGALASLATGWLVKEFTYAPVFVAAGLLHPLAWLLLVRLLPDQRYREERA
jgi:ACS family hexuronate transporter-like MFS transporter